MSMMAAAAKGVGAAAGASIGSNLFGKSGKEKGEEQRDYMDAAYGDLNQWEQAGAGQSGSADSTESNKTAERVAARNNKTQEDMNEHTNDTQKYNTHQNNQTAENINQATLDQQKGIVNGQEALLEAQEMQVKAQTAKTVQDTYNERKGSGVVGQTVGSAENMINEMVNTVKGYFDAGVPPAFKGGHKAKPHNMNRRATQGQDKEPSKQDMLKGVPADIKPANKGGRMKR